ncbi:MAG: hypothetical protein H7Z42_21615 [Roseiflexaceae bacterium]|nr:hypothetical protein [Roseiflexaceae bacterium]
MAAPEQRANTLLREIVICLARTIADLSRRVKSCLSGLEHGVNAHCQGIEQE